MTETVTVMPRAEYELYISGAGFTKVKLALRAIKRVCFVLSLQCIINTVMK